MNFASYHDGLYYLNGCGFWGVVSVLMMSRASANSLFDTAPLTTNPKRIVGWFLLGASVAALMNAIRMREAGYDKRAFILHKRVSENEQTHALLRVMRFHLTTRKMSVWDANSQ